MAVYDMRTRGDPVDQSAWSHCEIVCRRSYVSCSWVAVVDEREEMVRSPAFRWRKSGPPIETPEAVSCLAALEEWLVSEGWQPLDEPREAWYALRFCRPVVPLNGQIAPYRADSAPIALPDPLSDDEPTDIGPAAVELPALEAVDDGEIEIEIELEPVEPVQATQTNGGRRRAAREAEERLAVERAEVERADASRREAEWLDAVRSEAERLEAARLRAQRLEAERLDEERREAERLEFERLLAERVEAERLEAERLEAERLEAERSEAVRLEAERLEAARLEAARLEAERLEAERLEAERLEAVRLETERLEAERLEAERQEAERLEAERLEAERLEAERLEAERLAAEQEYALRDRIMYYAPGFDSNFNVRWHYGGPSTELDPARFERKRRRRR
jgi:hypothetical protein